jgi:hypothetical protein
MKFFIPHATTPAMAEKAYASFCKSAVRLPHLPGRLFRISFPHDRRLSVAEVGKEITEWREPSGIVMAIIEAADLIQIFTLNRGGLRDGPILVAPGEVRERTYFEDFPARPLTVSKRSGQRKKRR